VKGRPHWTWPPLGKHRRLPDDAILHASVYDRMRNVPAYQPKNAMLHTHPQEAYVPLFADAPGYVKTPDGQLATPQPAESRFDDLDSVGKVQAILDFKVDANPLLLSPPDMWPGFPIFAGLLTVAATLLVRPPGELLCWVLGEIVIFWLLRQVFRKLYRMRLIKHYKQHRDELIKSVPSELPKEPPPFVRPQWKAVCQLAAGLVAAVVVPCLSYPDSNWSRSASGDDNAGAGAGLQWRA
jgi:hypothetical protein